MATASHTASSSESVKEALKVVVRGLENNEFSADEITSLAHALGELALVSLFPWSAGIISSHIILSFHVYTQSQFLHGTCLESFSNCEMLFCPRYCPH